MIDPGSRTRVILASLVGTSIEFYDFYIYGTAAALVFGTLFFPSFSATAGTLASLATFAVGFVARPIGAVLFGHWGDRVGRKRMLIASLLVMGLSTVVIGLLPSYGSVGVVAPILLTVVRFLQGIGLGGEWGGAVLLATEYAPPGRRGLWSSFPQLGPAIGFALGNGLFLVLSATMSAATFESWGWRVPFLASAVLLALGYWIRTRIEETPVFRAALAAHVPVRAPFVALLRHQAGRLVLVTLSFTLAFTMFYTVTTFCLTYGTATLKIPRTTLLLAAIVASVVLALATMWSAHLSDRFGRRSMSLLAAVLCGAWIFPLFALLQTRETGLVVLALSGGLFCMGMLYGPMGAFLPELFRARFRYTGAAFAYSAAGIVGGGIGPIVATALLARTHSVDAVAWYVVAIAVLCLVATAALRETRDDDFSDGLVPAAPATAPGPR